MLADLKKLEFEKILLKIKNYAVTDLAKPVVLAIEPMSDQAEIERLLTETSQAKNMIERYDATPMTGVLNIKEAIKKAEIGSVLSIEEFLRITSHQEAIARSIAFIKKVHQLEIPSGALDEYYERLVSLPKVKEAIETVIDPKGEIYDSASSKLAQLRKKIKITEERIEGKMNQLVRSEANKLTDSIITIRNNRLVLPVRSEFKNSFQGVVHDSSASGETVFMEPMSCFILNNELQGILAQEKAEVERILRELTERIAEDVEPLRSNLEILTYLDIVFAKAKHAIEYRSHQPELTKSTIDLKCARHPLISQDIVVGNDINFRTFRHIVITGPNTGGKTVALKTLGLLSIMVQSGILIPVDEESKTIVFSGIFADIGDEQSIEQSLSTFSSHISNITYIIKHAKTNALVLLDEIGSGTDPKEGASLAISIINHLRNKNLYAMFSTHYPELKTYAFDLDDTVNASVEFDIETLRPTYRLRIGVPGTSNALQIAKRLGLHTSIIEAAEKVSISFDTDISHLIRKLETQSLELENTIQTHKSEISVLHEKQDHLDDLYVEEKIRQNKLMDQLEREKRKEMEALESDAKRIIRELDELKKSASFKEHELARLKHESKSIHFEDNQYQKVKSTKISEGDRVLLIPYQRNGIVNKRLSDGKYEVLMGTLSVTLEESDLEFIETPEKEKQPSGGTVTRTSQAKVELDLRGMRYLEAVDEIDKFVDTCLINNLEFSYIIHGYGTGALKKAVEEYIKKNNQIKNSRPGGPNEGGKGVTVIYFK
ncbi:MAG: endonuclease MutS2 [Bacilli bacterium]|nr:endonuclease MutS2 [Bacilli bacterium]MBN2877493.1 endonuclease MutS2 [Bacilli bacterium]